MINFSGIKVRVSCYSDLVEKIFFTINDLFFELSFSESKFNEIVEISYNEVASLINTQPYEKAFKYGRKILFNNFTHYSEMIKV
jgi:secreted Zn-dependent insulinase-like peptidase